MALRALGLGDLLTAVPALRALAAAYPRHRRLLAAPTVLRPIAGLTGAVDAVVDAAPLAPLPPSLAGADLAVNLHGRGPQSHRVLCEAWPRRLIAFAHPAVARSAEGPPWCDGEHEAARWCRLLVAHDVAADPSQLGLDWPGEPPEAARGATVIHPGAASAARRWPAERWAAVARAEAAAGRDVAVTGSPAERDLAAAVAARAGLPDRAVLAGRTDLLGLARAVAGAARVACGDTGVAHLASAFATPSVVLFGPVPPGEWGPPPRPWHRTLWKGRRGDPHGDRPDPGLMAISVDEVRAALTTLPEPSRRRCRRIT